MISFKDISESGNELKSLLSQVFVIPFWYVAIHIFHKDFFYDNDFFLIIAYCLCLTLVSSLLIGIIIIHTNDDLDIKEQGIFNIRANSTIVVLQIVWLSILIVSGYFFNVFFYLKFYFWSFLITYIVPISLIIFLVKTNKKKKEES